MRARRRQTARAGELRCTHGTFEGFTDVVLAWGEGSSKRDAGLLQHYLTGRPGEKSLCEELTNRGYDLSTLVFSVMKKVPEDAPESSVPKA